MRSLQDALQTEEAVTPCLEPSEGRRRETLQVSLLLLILLSGFFWKAVFLGRKLLPVDVVYANDPLYFVHAPPGFTAPHNVLLYDQAYQFYPARVYTLESLRRGFLPFWNPYVYCGAPFMAEEEPAVFYPLNVLFYPFSAADTFLLTTLARLFVTGLATYWFVRTIGGGRFGALLSTVSFTFGGFMIVWLGHQHTNVAAWLPALFLTVEWLYRKNSLQHVAFVALVMAAQLTGGRTELCLYTLTAGGLYYLFRVASGWWSDRQFRPTVMRLLSFSVAAVLGFALAAVHLLPFWVWLQKSAILQLRLGAWSVNTTRVGLRYWLSGVPLMILPNLLGNPTWPGTGGSFVPGLNFAEETLYVGIIPLCLAIGVIIGLRLGRTERGRHRQPVLFLATLGLITLGAAMRWPVLDMINHLPLFNIAHHSRFRLLYSFCMSVLAGLGACYISNAVERSSVTSPACRRRIRTLRAMVGLLAGFAGLGLFVLLVTPRILGRSMVDSAVLHAGQVSQDTLSWAFSVSNVSMYWPVLVALAGILVFVLYLRGLELPLAGERRRVLSGKMMQVAVLFLVIVDMFALGMNHHTTVPEEFVFPETPALQLVKSDKTVFRVMGTNTDFMPHTCMVHGLYDVRGLVFASSRYLEFCQAMGGRDWVTIGILFTEDVEPRLLNLLNVKYVLTSSALSPEALEDMILLDTDRQIRIYQNLSCLPRAFVVHRVRVGENDQAVLDTLLDPEFDPGAEIVLEKLPPSAFNVLSKGRGMASDRNLTAAVPAMQGQTAPVERARTESAEVASYDPNHVTILANTTLDGFLFLSDTYDVGWRAYVDGTEVEIYRADYAFRAVYLTPGQHLVEFVYEPPLFRLGSYISLFALLCTILLLASPRLRKAYAFVSRGRLRSRRRPSHLGGPGLAARTVRGFTDRRYHSDQGR